MKKINLLLLIVVLLYNNNLYSQDEKKSTKTDEKIKTKNFASIVSEATKDEGLFNVYTKKDKYYFEVPDSLIGSEMLMVTRVSKASVSLPSSLRGTKLNEQVLRWEKKNNNFLLRESSYVNYANDSLPINQAVTNSNFEQILFKFKIEARNDSLRSNLIDVTSLFSSDVKPLGYPQSSRKSSKISSLDTKLSFIESIKSYPKNIEIRHVKTYRSSDTESGTLSMEINNSMILLPEKPMKKRYFDQRVGWFTVSQTDYGIDNQEAKTVKFLQRWEIRSKR